MSANLLHQGQHGPDHASAKSLSRITPRGRREAEAQFYEFFRGGGSDRTSFGARFDRLADFLRAESLGCNWAFVSYLSFVYAPNRYFAIRPGAFDKLLEHLGIDATISGKVMWDRYQLALELGDQLRDFLAPYGRATAIDIQSYMWILSDIDPASRRARHVGADQLDFAVLLRRRQQAAAENERVGLAGERFVLAKELRRLKRAGRHDLAGQVSLVSATDPSSGYDIRSFDVDGGEIYIEVKTTRRPKTNDAGFYLPESERRAAETLSQWRIVRVWSIDDEPTHGVIGNVVREPGKGWLLSPCTWFVRPSGVAA